MSEQETRREMIDRLLAMSVDDGEGWDLSVHDQRACRAGAEALRVVLRMAHDEQCESELTSHGLTPCRCDERAAKTRPHA